jgi:hypothetical protein
MEGRETVTMDGGTRIKLAARPVRDAQRARVERMTASASDRAEVLRERFIAATVELLASASVPRMGKTRYRPTAA